jgi:hypothetical protein
VIGHSRGKLRERAQCGDIHQEVDNRARSRQEILRYSGMVFRQAASVNEGFPYGGSAEDSSIHLSSRMAWHGAIVGHTRTG